MAQLGPSYHGTASARLQRMAWDACTPLSTVFEITLTCNLRCVHCYNFDRAGPMPEGLAKAQLSTPEILTTIDALATEGCLYLAFSGGEALLHKDIFSFIKRARQNFMAVGLKSHGALLTDARVDSLVRAEVSSIDISLYGTTAEVHDAFTKIPGSFEASLRGLRATSAQPTIRTSVSFSLTEGNAHQAAAMVELAEEIGCSLSIDPQMTARHGGVQDPMKLRLEPNTLAELYRGPLRALQSGPKDPATTSVQCRCGRGVCGISAQGDVYPCIAAPLPCGNLREKSFAEIWNDSPQLKEIRGLTTSSFTKCEPCPDRAYCRRSSGAVYTNTGNYTGPEEWTCQEASILRQIGESEAAGEPVIR